MSGRRPATLADLHETALAMPFVTDVGPADRPIYQVGGKSFVFCRSKRPDAFDPVTGARYDDVIVVWVADEGERQALLQQSDRPYFTTAHFNGHPSVLIRASKLARIPRQELIELIQDAWCSRASQARVRAWLNDSEKDNHRSR